MEQSEVIYIADVAKLLGLSEHAVRAHVRRQTNAVPRPFKLGRKLAWRRVAISEFLRAAEAGA